MCGMGSDPGMTELRRGVLGPCVLALLDERPRFGLELVRELAAAGGLLTSDGTVYPLLSRLRDAGLVTSEWQDPAGERARRYYFITETRAATSSSPSAPGWTSSPRDRRRRSCSRRAGAHGDGTPGRSPAMSGTVPERRWSGSSACSWTRPVASLPVAQAEELARIDDARPPGRSAAFPAPAGQRRCSPRSWTGSARRVPSPPRRLARPVPGPAPAWRPARRVR